MRFFPFLDTFSNTKKCHEKNFFKKHKILQNKTTKNEEVIKKVISQSVNTVNKAY